ncbi:MAG: hypothetical protein ISR76_02615 [Planctomycetes bacterium]|nr:hypothetical protein [Planctomycetota bacterium]MBL7007863.1 hypothetical protein [Planctomycetota bacterium]
MFKNRLPLFESIAAVLAVAVVALLTALPSSGADPERDARLMDGLSLMRTSVFRFSMEHSDYQGAILPGRDGESVVEQLTGLSRNNGSTFDPLSGREDRWNGPYLRDLPVNPVNNLNTLRLDSGSGAPVLTGSAGWVYQPTTGMVLPDLPGKDPRGVLYADY